TLLVSIRARIPWCPDQVPACSSRSYRKYQECLPCIRRCEVHFSVKQVAASQLLHLSCRRRRRRYDYPVRRVRRILEQHARYPERSIRQAEARSRYDQILYRQRAVSIRRRHAEYHRPSRPEGQRTYRCPRERSEYVVVSRRERRRDCQRSRSSAARIRECRTRPRRQRTQRTSHQIATDWRHCSKRHHRLRYSVAVRVACQRCRRRHRLARPLQRCSGLLLEPLTYCRHFVREEPAAYRVQLHRADRVYQPCRCRESCRRRRRRERPCYHRRAQRIRWRCASHSEEAHLPSVRILLPQRRTQQRVVSFEPQIEVCLRELRVSSGSDRCITSLVEQLKQRRLRAFSYAAVRTDVRRLVVRVGQHRKWIQIRRGCRLRNVDLAQSRWIQRT